MIIHLNGWPGVGKLTVARALAEITGGRLVDNHTIYNLAFSLAPFRSEAFYELVRAVRRIAYARIAELPADQPVILTNALSRSSWGRENWQALLDLAERCERPLMAVTLICKPEEHRLRLATRERAYLGKLTDPSQLQTAANGLLEDDAHRTLRLDTTVTPPETSAAAIAAWLQAPELWPG
jgi:deoxyadenosine/deoxycytidine kinase